MLCYWRTIIFFVKVLIQKRLIERLSFEHQIMNDHSYIGYLRILDLGWHSGLYTISLWQLCQGVDSLVQWLECWSCTVQSSLVQANVRTFSAYLAAFVLQESEQVTYEKI